MKLDLIPTFGILSDTVIPSLENIVPDCWISKFYYSDFRAIVQFGKGSESVEDEE